VRIIPRTLGGQLIALLLLALALSQGIALAIYASERAEAVRQADRSGLLESAASVLRVLRLAAAEARPALAAAASSPRVRIWVSAESAARPGVLAQRLPAQYQRQLGLLPEAARFEILRDGQPLEVRPAPAPIRPGAARQVGAEPFTVPAGQPQAAPVQAPSPARITGAYDILVSIPFADGTWLNAQTQIMAEPVNWAWASTASTVVMVIAILLIIAFTANRATRPLRALAARADALGRGTPEPPMAEEGPDEVRRVTVAFNRMQERLSRFVADRTRMIAAIGHDLRTPITSLKLRAELLEDEETRSKMLLTLEDMQRMVEATLAFARDDATAETPRSVDLAALIATVVDDQADMGKDVTFAEAERLPYRCRPTALKRALINLITNAVQYGERARVTLENAPGGPVIGIDDDGPGIPEENLEYVFQPFVRLETSRSRATGGVGLGLSIARSIVLAHGGELVLANRRGGGLRAEIRLPPSEPTATARG
jgi:signal transduction histidine kinase